MSDIVVETVGLTKHFRRGARTITLFDDLDMTLRAGELLAVTGPSLSGKTVLVDMLAGWQQPDAGLVAWTGESDRPPPWSQLTVVPQSLVLLEELSVRENILLAPRLAGRRADRARSSRLDELLEALGLSHLADRGGHEISVGERQRTMVARAMLDRPEIVLADEPVAHQDEHHASIVLDLLRRAVEDGAAVVLSTRQEVLAAGADSSLSLPC